MVAFLDLRRIRFFQNAATASSFGAVLLVTCHSKFVTV